jgi:hypothetical protein
VATVHAGLSLLSLWCRTSVLVPAPPPVVVAVSRRPAESSVNVVDTARRAHRTTTGTIAITMRARHHTGTPPVPVKPIHPHHTRRTSHHRAMTGRSVIRHRHQPTRIPVRAV